MMTRRQFLLLGFAGAMLLAVGGGVPIVRRYRARMLQARHQTGPRDEAPLAPHLLSTLVSFTGALYGVVLTDTDRLELEDRIQFTASEDSGWRSEFEWLTWFADQRAQGLDAVSFVELQPAQSELLIQSIMGEPVRDRRHRLLAMVSEQERNRRRFRISTVAQLKRVYQSSGVPWRRRGYQSWPGLPGDPRVYTRPGTQYAC
jgi:hypothetical protein